jgi:hypothetical protein
MRDVDLDACMWSLGDVSAEHTALACMLCCRGLGRQVWAPAAPTHAPWSAASCQLHCGGGG